MKPRQRTEVGELVAGWWTVARYPSVRTFDGQRAAANWRAVWASLLALAAIEALAVAYVVYGPDAAAGYSSLPAGPKLHLPQTPLLPLAALAGSVGQFFVFAGLLALSARLFGGRGAFKTQAYLFALFWVPLMALSDISELIPVVGAWLAVLVRAYALCLCALALASAYRMPLARAWGALLAVICAGLLLGAVVLGAAYASGILSGSVKILG